MESLVIYSCVIGKGCQQTSTAYYESHPEIKQFVHKNEERVKQFVGPVFIQSVAPFWFLAAGGTGNIRLSKEFSLELKKYQELKLVFSRSF